MTLSALYTRYFVIRLLSGHKQECARDLPRGSRVCAVLLPRLCMALAAEGCVSAGERPGKGDSEPEFRKLLTRWHHRFVKSHRNWFFCVLINNTGSGCELATDPEISLRISTCYWVGWFARWPLCFETLFQSKTHSGLLGDWGLFYVRSAVQEHPNRDRWVVLVSLGPELWPQLATATNDEPQVQGRLEPSVC